MRQVFLGIILLCSYQIGAQSQLTLYATAIKDSFDIYINAPLLENGKPRTYIYYLDAGIKSGKELRRQIALQQKQYLVNIVFVGIAHRGNFHEKRRRDFIPPSVTGFTGGHADLFYSFLERTVITKLESTYGKAVHRALTGHSFGGLFTFYSLFREDRLFHSYFSLSPSLWMNNYAIFHREAAFHIKNTSLPAYLYLSAGDLERMNYIITGNRRMRTLLEHRKYQGLQLEYIEFSGATHNSQVPLSMKCIMSHIIAQAAFLHDTNKN